MVWRLLPALWQAASRNPTSPPTICAGINLELILAFRLDCRSDESLTARLAFLKLLKLLTL